MEFIPRHQKIEQCVLRVKSVVRKKIIEQKFANPAALDAVRSDPELAANLGAAAHLVHGSSEGRFRIVYCTDPAAGGLTREEVESVGYGWRPLAETLGELAVDARTPTGQRRDAQGDSFFHVANPAMGLWSTRELLQS